MKKLILIVCLCTVWGLRAQQPLTEEMYLHEDSILWISYEARMNELYGLMQQAPEKKDSLMLVADKELNEVLEKNWKLAIRYASVPSGLQRVYMTRLDMPKDTLVRVLASLPAEMQDSFYGRCIRGHIETDQIEEGDPVVEFPCVTIDGSEFDWSVAEGKQLLMLYSGLSCMGEWGRQQLKEIYEQTSRDDLLVFVYWPCESLEALQQAREQYEFECDNYYFVSDFKGDATPMKIKYGTQATPTCFLTDRDHTVKVKCIGLDVDRMEPYLARTKK